MSIYNQDISNIFKKKKALIGYITLGDPSVELTYEYGCTLIENGVDIIEIGMPFSDPIADGPVIQASHQRALSTNEDVSLRQAFKLITKLKKRFPKTPIVIMTAINLVIQYSVEKCFKDAKACGCDGFILPDCSIEMATDYTKQARKAQISLIHLISPLCSSSRLKKIVNASEGFLYLISSTGITGERDAFATNLSHIIKSIKAVKDIPVAVGFGISKPDHVRDIYSFADGAIVGSHLIQVIAKHKDKNKTCEALKKSIKTLLKT